MKRLAAAMLVLAGCGPFIQPSESKPLCPDDLVNVNTPQGPEPRCRIRIGQRYVVEMPKSQGSEAGMRSLCLNVWHGTEFKVNFGALDYCVLPKRTS